MKKNKKTILITGASGMLGTKLSKILSGNNQFYIIAAYNSQKGLLSKLNRIGKKSLDITSPESVKKLKETFARIDHIIHCAAITDVNRCELEKKLCSLVNVTGTKNMINLAKYFNSDFIYISTPMIFNGRRGDYKENARPSPINYYAKTKLLAEKEVQKYKRGFILRVNPIGVRRPGVHPGFIQWFVQKAKNNESFTLFSDVKINPISTTTLSKIIAKLILNSDFGILHLGSRDVANKAEIWKYILKRFPNFKKNVREESVSKTSAGKIAKRPREMWLNVQKAVRLGYKMPSWKKEVDLVLKELNL